MQVARTHFVSKSAALSSVAKNASCSRGWLHVTVQFIFAVITTVSFVLIVMMTVTNPKSRHKPETAYPRCIPQNCRVVCTEAPYYGKWEDDILNAVAVAEPKCIRIILDLHHPYFENNTLPNNWLPKLQSNIYELCITGGNLQHLPTGAFMSKFTGYTKTLSLQDLSIKTFYANSLVGLSSLETLNIVNSEISFQANSLRAVDDTLQTLTITQSGFWDPINVTGSRGYEQLAIVDFSHNDFNTVLGKESFDGLEHCKILYLNSCGIVSIGAGAFDQLSSIQVIYLHRNLLVAVPPGLFNSIVLLENPRPRISLQENSWYCDCGADDLRQLVRKDILLVDTTCTYPVAMNDKTFTEFDKSCVSDTEDSFDVKLFDNNKTVHHASFNDRNVFIYGKCRKKNNIKNSNNENKMTFRLVSPQENSRCSLNRTTDIDVGSLSTTPASFNNSNWLNFSFFLKKSRSTTFYLGATETNNFGLLWFQSDCPNDLYCIDSMPSFLRIYNVNEKSQYTFCPMRLSTGNIENNSCVGYSMVDAETLEKSTTPNYLNWLIYTITVLGCFCFGAAIVYGLIRINPILLKGSKRILFVKHKTVDALVLPPKIPLRNDLINDTALDFSDKDIFILSSNDILTLPKINRMKSIHSNISNSPSYISALQPSEDQMAEWRISRHFNNDLTISSKSELSTFSWICGDTSYYSLDESDRT